MGADDSGNSAAMEEPAAVDNYQSETTDELGRLEVKGTEGQAPDLPEDVIDSLDVLIAVEGMDDDSAPVDASSDLVDTGLPPTDAQGAQAISGKENIVGIAPTLETIAEDLNNEYPKNENLIRDILIDIENGIPRDAGKQAIETYIRKSLQTELGKIKLQVPQFLRKKRSIEDDRADLIPHMRAKALRRIAELHGIDLSQPEPLGSEIGDTDPVVEPQRIEPSDDALDSQEEVVSPTRRSVIDGLKSLATKEGRRRAASGDPVYNYVYDVRNGYLTTQDLEGELDRLDRTLQENNEPEIIATIHREMSTIEKALAQLQSQTPVTGEDESIAENTGDASMPSADLGSSASIENITEAILDSRLGEGLNGQDLLKITTEQGISLNNIAEVHRLTRLVGERMGFDTAKINRLTDEIKKAMEEGSRGEDLADSPAAPGDELPATDDLDADTVKIKAKELAPEWYDEIDKILDGKDPGVPPAFALQEIRLVEQATTNVINKQKLREKYPEAFAEVPEPEAVVGSDPIHLDLEDVYKKYDEALANPALAGEVIGQIRLIIMDEDETYLREDKIKIIKKYSELILANTSGDEQQELKQKYPEAFVEEGSAKTDLDVDKFIGDVSKRLQNTDTKIRNQAFNEVIAVLTDSKNEYEESVKDKIIEAFPEIAGLTMPASAITPERWSRMQDPTLQQVDLAIQRGDEQQKKDAEGIIKKFVADDSKLSPEQKTALKEKYKQLLSESTPTPEPNPEEVESRTGIEDYIAKMEAELGVREFNRVATTWRREKFVESIKTIGKWGAVLIALFVLIYGLSTGLPIYSVPSTGFLGLSFFTYSSTKARNWWAGGDPVVEAKMKRNIGYAKALNENFKKLEKDHWRDLTPDQQASISNVINAFAGKPGKRFNNIIQGAPEDVKLFKNSAPAMTAA